MIRQYPHKMTVTTVGGPTTQDSSGNWQTAASTTSNEIDCRYETSDGNGYVVTESGAQEYYDAIVYMPLPVNTIKIGSSVVITDNGVQIGKGQVKHFHPGQLNARLWL